MTLMLELHVGLHFHISILLILLFTLLRVYAATSVLKSAKVNMGNIGLKNIRNRGVIERIFNKIGFVMCARQCEKHNNCVGFNYMRSDLLCELLTSIGDNKNDMVGWRFVNISSILEDNTLSTKSRGELNLSAGRNIQLFNGSLVCLKKDFPLDCGNSSLMPQEAHSGVYEIRPKNGEKKLTVFCDMTTDGNGWTVNQKRTRGNVNFDKDWNTYKNGFGDLTGEHWLGNDALYTLTSAHDYILKIEMTTTDGEYKFATYSQFFVANDIDAFRITVSGYSGNATDGLLFSSGMCFATVDRDDCVPANDCSTKYGGGWWFGINNCVGSHLNPRVSTCSDCVNVYWYPNLLKVMTVTMKIKRKE